MVQIAKAIYRTFGCPDFSAQVVADLVEWAGVSEQRIMTFFRYGHLNVAI